MNVIPAINSNNPLFKKNNTGNAIAQFVLPFLADVHPFALTSKASLDYVKKQIVENVRKELLKLDVECNIAIALFKPLPQFPEKLDLGAYRFKTVSQTSEAKYEEFTGEICDAKGECHPNANYKMRYYALATEEYPAKRLELAYSFRADLPIKVSPGIPTTLAIHHRILHQMTKKGFDLRVITHLSANSVDAQTVVDYFHGRIVKGYSQSEAFAHCHTSRIMRDIGAMLGASEVRLTRAQNSGKKFPLLELLDESLLPEDQIAAFKVQPKIRELQAKTCNAFDLENADLMVPCNNSLCFTLKF